jgi:serine/threonine-protein kinase RsbT
MSELRIPIHSEFDVMTARLEARNLARRVGMNTGDQARIAMATSSVAHERGMGGSHDGYISIDELHENDQIGIQVTCTETGGPTPATSRTAIQDARWMVDSVKVEQLASQAIQVTMTKWLLPVRGLAR